MISFISTLGYISHIRYFRFNVYSWQYIEFVLFLGSLSRLSNGYLLELVTLIL